MQLFETFFEIKEKKPLKRWKRPILLDDLERAKEYEEYGGRLAQDIVLIDIDDIEQAECLLNIVEDLELLCQVRRTDRGMHFYFKNDGTFLKCGAHKKLAIGLEADIKVGVTNAYAKLKSHGVERKVIYNVDELQTIPKWLRPLSNQQAQIDVFNLADGEGRNPSLYKHIIYLINTGFSIEECKDCIKLINQYILKESLEQKELETILRDEAFENLIPNFYDEKKGVNIEKLSKFIIDKLFIKRIDGKIYAYNDGYYVLGQSLIRNNVLQYCKNTRTNIRNEVESYIKDFIIEDTPVADSRYIGIKNGIYDLSEQKLIPFNPNIVITNYIKHDYDPNAYDINVDNFLEETTCGDKRLRSVLEEVIGYCLLRDNRIQKFFILYGIGSNGKSIFCSFLRSMLGNDNCSSESLQRLGERFGSSSIYGKLANICDDNSSLYINDPSMIKSLTSGGNIQMEFKQKDSFPYKPHCKLIFCTNTLPKIKDNGTAVQRRLLIIPFENQVEETKQDLSLESKLTCESAAKYGLKLGINALNRLLKNGNFTECEKIKGKLEEYFGYNNPVANFVKMQGGENYILSNYCKNIYQDYLYYCKENNNIPESAQQFGKKICSLYSVESFSVNPKDGTDARHKKYRKKLITN